MADQLRTGVQRQFGHLQALDDALAYRLARVAVPCADCETAGEGKCDDHACDLDLIESYRQAHAEASGAMSARRLATVQA